MPRVAQFTATGYFNEQPSSVTLSAANWGVCYQRTTAVSVNTDGLAQCAAGALAHIQFGPGPRVLLAPVAATTARALRTLAAEPAPNANLQVQRN